MVKTAIPFSGRSSSHLVLVDKIFSPFVTQEKDNATLFKISETNQNICKAIIKHSAMKSLIRNGCCLSYLISIIFHLLFFSNISLFKLLIVMYYGHIECYFTCLGRKPDSVLSSQSCSNNKCFILYGDHVTYKGDF